MDDHIGDGGRLAGHVETLFETIYLREGPGRPAMGD